MTPFLYDLTSSNIDQFSNFFHCPNQEKIVLILSLKIGYHTSTVSLHYLKSNN